MRFILPFIGDTVMVVCLTFTSTTPLAWKLPWPIFLVSELNKKFIKVKNRTLTNMSIGLNTQQLSIQFFYLLMKILPPVKNVSVHFIH